MVNDLNLLGLVANHPRLLASPVIRPFEPAVAQRYAAYVHAQGNPWTLGPDAQFQGPKASFHAVYAKPPKALAFIADMRNAASGACPMCGSDGNGTLDHYLPKAAYPEFSFFSLNLVPACFRCNTVRLANYIGHQADERAIHPYYDPAASQRLLTVTISPPFNVPAFTATAWNPPAAIAAAVHWHIENVVEPTGFAKHCQQRWSRLIDDPQRYLGQVATFQAVSHQLLALSELTAHLSESPNSWDSCFFHGCAQNGGAITYLVGILAESLQAVQAPGANPVNVTP